MYIGIRQRIIFIGCVKLLLGNASKNHMKCLAVKSKWMRVISVVRAKENEAEEQAVKCRYLDF